MNRLLSDIEVASVALAVVVLAVAVLLGWSEWLDRQARPAELSPEDEQHYRRRDRRRSTGLSILCVVALCIVVGSRTPPRVDLQPNPTFLVLWLAVFGQILALLALAMADWIDLRRFARRKKHAIGREHRAIVHQIDRWRDAAQAEGNGGDPRGDESPL